MIAHRGVIAGLLTLVVAACDGTAGASAQPVVLESDAEATVAVTASPARTDSAPPQPTPEPTPPPPPKPKGVTFEYHNEELEGGGAAGGDTGAIGDYILTVTWERPRTKETQIRVYGVTKCFEPGASGVDDYCLRKHTPLPSDVRVLVAKTSASKGTVTFRLPFGDHGSYAKDGRNIYSLVIGAYNESGHSIFEIVDPGSYCASVGNCDTY